jgi:hypothetical protein
VVRASRREVDVAWGGLGGEEGGGDDGQGR